MTLKEEEKAKKFYFWSKKQIETPERRKTRPRLGRNLSRVCEMNGSDTRGNTWRDLNGY